MSILTIRKNFNFEKKLIDKTSLIIKKRDINFTQLLTNYFEAIVKDPDVIEIIEQKANQRTGSFIGLLDGGIGDLKYKDSRSAYHENIS